MPAPLPLTQLDQNARTSVSDVVFEHLRQQVLGLSLPPGTKLSEVEVAKQLGVSRQPVRDAFYRMSKLGFLVIRPQRATTVSLISRDAVLQARFIRNALEVETVRVAVAALTDEDLAALRDLIEQQRAAMEKGEKTKFHELDDQFHREICTRAGLGFTWELIAENKGHMDRVRMLSLSFASRDAFDDHVKILTALESRDLDRATQAMRDHLSRILDQIDRIQDDHTELFEVAPQQS